MLITILSNDGLRQRIKRNVFKKSCKCRTPQMDAKCTFAFRNGSHVSGPGKNTWVASRGSGVPCLTIIWKAIVSNESGDITASRLHQSMLNRVFPGSTLLRACYARPHTSIYIYIYIYILPSLLIEISKLQDTQLISTDKLNKCYQHIISTADLSG